MTNERNDDRPNEGDGVIRGATPRTDEFRRKRRTIDESREFEESLESELAAANKRVAEMEEANIKLLRREFPQMCSSCGWFSTGEGGWDELQAHIRVCPKHIMRDVEAERDALKSELSAWHSQFGTSQLSHAIAIKESTESELARAREAILPIPNWEAFADFLAKHNIVDPASVEDGEGYDMNNTLEKIESAYIELRKLAHPPEQPSDLSKCPKCGGAADNGHDRCDPPNAYHCTKCERPDGGKGGEA